MNYPDWREFTLQRGGLREPTADRDRIVVWIPTDRDPQFQYWQRIANVPRAEVLAEHGLYTTAATSVPARQNVGSIVERLWDRLRTSAKTRSFVLPDGSSAEQCGDRQNDLTLVWSEKEGRALDETVLNSLWPDAREITKVGENLFLVAGLKPSVGDRDRAPTQPPIPAGDSPVAHAEALLAAARHSGTRDKEATALTDLGVLALNKGDHQDAIKSLEAALAITLELGDIAREGDVVGNLGMAMLAARQPDQARTLFERALDRARSTGNRFAEKVAFERLGIASWNLHDNLGALAWFDRALSLARQLGDRQQEANLLWHQGIQHAELGQRELAIARASESIALFTTLGRPQAGSYGAYLQKYRMGAVDESLGDPALGVTVDQSPPAYQGGSIVAGVTAGPSSADPVPTKTTSGPGLLRMALSATKAMAGFAGSGFKIAPPETQRRRLETCTTCEHHTGVRCQICGCFTNAKSRILHEDCPIGKWPP